MRTTTTTTTMRMRTKTRRTSSPTYSLLFVHFHAWLRKAPAWGPSVCVCTGLPCIATPGNL